MLGQILSRPPTHICSIITKTEELTFGGERNEWERAGAEKMAILTLHWMQAPVFSLHCEHNKLQRLDCNEK